MPRTPYRFPGTALLTGVTLQPWVDNTVPHGLGKTYSGFILTRPTSTVCDLNVKLASAQSCAIGEVDINLDTITWDLGSNFNTTTHRFTAPVDGDYFIQGVVSWVNMLQYGYSTSGYEGSVCGKYYWHTWINAWTSSIKNPFHNMRQRLTQGETVKVWAFHGACAGGPNPGTQSANSELHISLVDDGVRESPTFNPAPNTNIILRVSYEQTVDLIVF